MADNIESVCNDPSIKIPKKRGRKKKKPDETPNETDDKPLPKKRGRKPRGGKIITPDANKIEKTDQIQNIILHLKCKLSDLSKENQQIENSNEIMQPFCFNKPKNTELIDNDTMFKQIKQKNKIGYKKDKKNNDETIINEKLLELATQLHANEIVHEKSACFWCTCDFDNPPIHIPKYKLSDTYHCYGCFCSPECAAAHLFGETIDSSIQFKRYHLLNYLYCKIYNYNDNIKPAPSPYYILDKYYGNLTIQEYRKQFKNDRLLLVVDKPLTRILPEIYDDNALKTNSGLYSTGGFNIRRKSEPQSKKTIVEDAFSGK